MMNEHELAAIEGRYAVADAEVGSLYGGPQRLIGMCVDDIPALVAEVRRLRAKLQEIATAPSMDVSYFDGPVWCSYCAAKAEIAQEALDHAGT